jgi:hydroxymethylpyrimidine/phosphomethylpyrimidine kinase
MRTQSCNDLIVTQPRADQTAQTPVVLTIAGLDPSGGAGLVADVQTIAAFGCFPAAVVTSLTFQNTKGVRGAAHQTAATISAQVLPVIEDLAIAAVKTGMLPTRESVAEVARLLRETDLRAAAVVVDPVVRSTSGHDLIDTDALAALQRELLPRATLITPNVPEAERLTGLRITDESDMRAAARALREQGARAVLVKGGHLAGDDALDLLDDDGEVQLFHTPRIHAGATHGTGCTLAAAIAACLARGLSLPEAVDAAKRYVTAAIRRAPQLGHGARPLAHAIKVQFTARGVLIDEEYE